MTNDCNLNDDNNDFDNEPLRDLDAASAEEIERAYPQEPEPQKASGDYVSEEVYAPPQQYYDPVTPVPPTPPTPPVASVASVKPSRKGRKLRLQGKPGRFVFADMAGVLLYVWVPVLLAVFLPWGKIFGDNVIAGDLTISQLVVALIIAIPAWIVLLNHLRKGRLLDGVLDMLLWGIWECMAVIIVSFFYQEQAREVFWNSASYWNEMRGWLVTGEGAEGDPSVWLLSHAKHLILILIAAVPFGLPALVMGVLQLNYMNFYVAKCMLASDNPLLTGFVAWHIWSIVRVAGFITLASTIFHAVLGLITRIHWRMSQFVWGLTIGFGLVILDGLLKWQLAERLRQVLLDLTSL